MLLLLFGPINYQKILLDVSIRTGLTQRRRHSPSIKRRSLKTPRTLKPNLTELRNIVLLFVSLFILNKRSLILDKRRITSLKSKLTVVPLNKRLSLLMDCSNKKLELIKSSIKTNKLMLLVLLVVRELLVLLKDLVLSTYKRRLTEVTEELDVSVHGILLMLDGLLLEQVN